MDGGVSNVEAIKSAARHLADQGKCLSDRRVFISDVVDALLPQNPGWTEAQIKEAMRTMDRTVMFATGDPAAADGRSSLGPGRWSTPTATTRCS
jgi:hypothetical protein